MTSPTAAESAASTSALTAEDQAQVEGVMLALRDMDAWAPGDDGMDAARAMITSVVMGTANADKVAKETGLNRDKVRVWFKNLRASNVCSSDGTWYVEWFDEGGFLALILDVMVAQGLVERKKPEDNKCEE